jgi:signal peptidase I
MRVPARALVGLVVLFGLAIAALFVLRVAGVLRTWRIPASSMEPTLHCARPGPLCRAGTRDRVLSLKYLRRDPKRGDIVVFRTPPAASTRCGAGGFFVKRIVALPGERWEERNGRVFVDGRALREPYVARRARDTRTIAPVRLGRDRYFVLGDNRIASCDSREWGGLARGAIIGKVVLRYWPPTRIGSP